MSRSQRYNDNDDDDNSDYSYEVTSNDDDDDEDFQIHKNIMPNGKSSFEINLPQRQHQQMSHQRPQQQQSRSVQKQKSKQKVKAKHYHVHPQRKPRRLFTPEEDQLLLSLVEKYGPNSWPDIAEKIPGRSSRQCKERYTTYLCPTVNHSPWTDEEDLLLLQKVHEIGKRWSDMSKFFNGRTANAIKNRYHLHLRGHFNDNRNKHQQPHHKDIPLSLCSRTQQQPISNGSAILMNPIPGGFSGIQSSNTASSSPLAQGAAPSSTVYYAYPSNTYSNNSNNYPPNLNQIIFIPSNYDIPPIKERPCEIIPNSYNGYNPHIQMEPQYIHPNAGFANINNQNPSLPTQAIPNSTVDYNYYGNNNFYSNSSNGIGTYSQNPQYIINNPSKPPSSFIQPQPPPQPPIGHSFIQSNIPQNPAISNQQQTAYVKAEEPPPFIRHPNTQMIFNNPPELNDHSGQPYNYNSPQNPNSKYQISSFLNEMNNGNNNNNNEEERPKDGQSKTRILLPPLQALLPN